MKDNFYFLLLIILITSCKEEFDDIPDIGRKIVINGLITTDSLLNVRIGKSTYINDISGNSGNELNDLDSAKVQIYMNGTLIDSLNHVPFYSFYLWNVFNSGNYRSKSVFPKPGHQYTIIAKVYNIPEASTIITIPDLVSIVKVDTSRIILSPGSYINSNEGFICKIEFVDPANRSNYYMFNIREIVNKDCATPNNNLEFYCLDPFVEEKLFSGIKNEGIAFSDKLFNGQRHTLSVIIKREVLSIYSPGNKQTICFRLYSITEEFFQYIKNLNLYNKNLGNPLAEPVMIYSNIKGGYGMVTGASVSSDSIVFQY